MAVDSGKTRMIDRDEAELLQAIDAGVRDGVRAALLAHKRAGRSIVIWRDGKVVELPPEEIPVEEDGPESG
jgi:hypothetical protein